METVDGFTASHLAAAAEDAQLRFPQSVLGALVAALRAGKHVIVTGPPGTGKSTLARMVADLGRDAMMCTGCLPATATSAWTVVDTVGGLVDGADGRVFRPGVVTSAIESGRWLLIDELNRADMDRAFGELFSVLAGQPVVLPYGRTELSPPIAIVPHGCEPPPQSEPLCIPRPWRIIATMNTSDRSLLFNLSRALLRRFAFVRLPSPEDTAFRQLVAGPGAIVERLLPIRELQEIGPAAFIDAADVAAARLLDGADESEVLLEVFTAYVVPQLEPMGEQETSTLLAMLDRMLVPREQHLARATLREFGLLRDNDVLTRGHRVAA